MGFLPRRWLALALVLPAFAAAPAWAGRPLETEDTTTVAPGAAEVELSGLSARGSGDNLWLATGVFSLGVLPRLEGRIEGDLRLLDRAGERGRGGIGDSLVGFKYRLLDEEGAIPALLTALALKLPTRDAARGLGTRGVDVAIIGAVSKTFGAWTLTGNAGYTFVTGDRGLDFATLAASAEYRATTMWTIVAEAVGMPGTGRRGGTVVARGGALYAISQRIRLDGAVGVGLTRASPDVVFTLGVTVGLF